MNLYATVDEFTAVVTTSKSDSALLWFLEGASREVERLCKGRVFWTEIGIRYFDGPERNEHVGSSLLALRIDDCLAVTGVEEDTDGDWSYGQEWTDGTDFVVGPYQFWPKRELVWLPGSALSFVPGTRRYRVTGTWGAGDLLGNGWEPAGVTLTVGDGTSTSATVSAPGVVQAGHTIQAGDEQLFVTGVSGTTLTVERGVNGTTGVAHDAASVSLAAYPQDARAACVWLAAEAHNAMERAGISSEGIGQFRQVFSALTEERRRRLVGRIKKQ